METVSAPAFGDCINCKPQSINFPRWQWWGWQHLAPERRAWPLFAHVAGLASSLSFQLGRLVTLLFLVALGPPPDALLWEAGALRISIPAPSWVEVTEDKPSVNSELGPISRHPVSEVVQEPVQHDRLHLGGGRNGSNGAGGRRKGAHCPDPGDNVGQQRLEVQRVKSAER
eukprot:g41595.t1